MQQFFWLVNQFLREQPRTQRRALSIRTYKVPAPPPRRHAPTLARKAGGCAPNQHQRILPA